MKTLASAAVLLLAAVTAGCANNTNALIQTLKFAVGRDSSAADAHLRPDFRYLRATMDGRVALLVLGYEEKNFQGPVQIWYSAQREVLRLQNGRVVGAVGLVSEWRNVTLSSPSSWAAIARSEGESRWVRTRDVMPGYRFGLRDNLVVRPIPPPPRSELQALDPKTLSWFEERHEYGSPTEASSLPPAKYAVALQGGAETVVYGEQCLTPEVCFTWQSWPPTPNKKIGQ